MQVLIVNESKGKALIRTRRVLSCLLPQLGERTWCGTLDSQGLDELRRQLKAVASKNASIACHRLSRHARELLWVVGAKQDFDDQGRLCFRTRRAAAASPVRRAQQGQGWRVLRDVTRMAALLHDIGKASVLFNKKLRNPQGPQSEPLRHELLSYLMVLDALAERGDSGDLGWLDALADNPRVIAAGISQDSLLSDAARDKALRLMQGGAESTAFPRQLAALQGRRPVLASVAWLVLTHHRLPGTRKAADLSEHVHPERARDADAVLNLRPACGLKPWEDERWLAQLQSCAQRLAGWLRSQRPVLQDVTQLALACAHVARPALILGDYLASILKTESHSLSEEDVLLANTRSLSEGGDSLTTHLLSARQHSDVLYRLRRDQDFAFQTTRLPADSPALAAIQDERFMWQQQAADCIAQQVGSTPHAGLFAVVSSRTGAGKTLAGVRILHAASQGALRYSLALSRRSLTLQAGEDYLLEAGLPGRDVAVAVGSAVSAKLAASGARGSDSLDDAADGLEVARLGADESSEQETATTRDDSRDDSRAWSQLLSGADETLLRSRKLRQLIDAPVLVATVDHLVGAVELLRGRHSLLSLRTMSADLVLDEVDNYSAGDLVSLGKLVFAAGVYRRKVVLMSATLARPIVESFYAAYVAGLNLAAELDGATLPHLTALVCDGLAAQVGPADGMAAFMAQYDAFTEAYLAQLDAAAARTVLGELDMAACTTTEDIVKTVLQGTHELHARNHTVDEQTGVRYSLGFVRWNTAKTCLEATRLAASLEQQAGEPLVKFVSYHAKQTLLALHFLDRTLGRVLKRTAGRQPHEHPEVRKALQEAQEQGKTDLIIVVMTTSLLETGRNHDYDWCVLEPRSPRAETQAVGRVRRHRPQPWHETNVLLMSKNVRAIVGSRAPVWGQPGVERPGTPFKVRSSLPAALRPLAAATRLSCAAAPAEVDVSQATHALPVAEWKTKMTSRACLQIPRAYELSRIGALEQLELYARLVNGCGLEIPKAPLPGQKPAFEPLPVALNQYLQKAQGLPHCWSAVHAQRTRFRRSEDDKRAEHGVFINPARGWSRVLVQSDARDEELEIEGIMPELVNESRFWLDVPAGLRELWTELSRQLAKGSEAERLHQEAVGCRVSAYEVNALGLKGSYSAYLGFDVR